MLRAFWDELDRRGFSPVELERLSGVCRPPTGDCATIMPVEDMHRLFEAAVGLTREPTLGLTVGRAVGATGFHLIGHLVLASGTLTEALQRVMRVQPQIRKRHPLVAELADGRLRIGFTHVAPTLRIGARVEAELTAVVLHDVVLHFFADQTHDRPCVELPFPAPDDASAYRRTFPGGVRFDADGTFVCVQRSALAPRRSGADAALLEHLTQLALDQYAAADTDEDWTSRVRRALRSHAAPRQLDLCALARQLGVSERGLSRRLAREGSSLSSLQDEALYERAQALLRRPGATAAQVAEALGYAELSSFFRAFRRWSGGLTPNAYRQAAS
jgi:AraC-like DNA-binding protein